MKDNLESFTDFKDSINNTRARGGQYWTNMVGCQLRMASDKLGMAEANRLIIECKLKKYGWQEEPDS